MKHLKSIVYVFTILLFSCSSTQECQEQLNLVPMYGQHKKCDYLANSDSVFVKFAVSEFHSRKAAAKHLVARGWEYWYKNTMDTAMFRFNQAWLLDSTNADIYWGFANILGAKGQYTESIVLFESAIRLNPKNTALYQGIATSYGNRFFQTKEVSNLDRAISYLKICVVIDPSDTLDYSQLTNAYSYFSQKDSAIKYLRITDKLDSNVINPEVRKLLKEKQAKKNADLF